MRLRISSKAIPPFILRNEKGEDLFGAEDLVDANRAARATGLRVLVFKNTPEGEVLMSRTGPGKWIFERDSYRVKETTGD